MNRNSTLAMLTAVTLALAATPRLSAEETHWIQYESPDYGFSMLVPGGTELKTREWDGGWGGLHATHEGVNVYGVAKIGEWADAKEIESFGVRLTGIPASRWTEVDKGAGNGWRWFRTVKAKTDGQLVYGGYGHGAKGSYLVIIVTTPGDFHSYREQYQLWYDSIRLN